MTGIRHLLGFKNIKINWVVTSNYRELNETLLKNKGKKSFDRVHDREKQKLIKIYIYI